MIERSLLLRKVGSKRDKFIQVHIRVMPYFTVLWLAHCQYLRYVHYRRGLGVSLVQAVLVTVSLVYSQIRLLYQSKSLACFSGCSLRLVFTA